MNELSKVAGCKINRQKSVLLLYTNNYQKEKPWNNLIYTCTKKNKYIAINLTEEMKDLHSKNYKTLMKEIKDHKNK